VAFSADVVTEDIDIIALHHYLRARMDYRMVFTTDPICWTEAPQSLTCSQANAAAGS